MKSFRTIQRPKATPSTNYLDDFKFLACRSKDKILIWRVEKTTLEGKVMEEISTVDGHSKDWSFDGVTNEICQSVIGSSVVSFQPIVINVAKWTGTGIIDWRMESLVESISEELQSYRKSTKKKLSLIDVTDFLLAREVELSGRQAMDLANEISYKSFGKTGSIDTESTTHLAANTLVNHLHKDQISKLIKDLQG